MDEEADAWFDRELAGCSLADERLNKRLRKVVAQIGSAMGESIPLVCQDWANTKAAYRFFSNDRVSEADILAGHFQSTVSLPPIGKQKRYPALTLTVIHAEERVTPKKRKKVEWKLITDLPVSSL
ncbi:IS4/Tn5 family transposase DNA-binding protein [Bradyrhizobium cytisi]|uniref:IS4/Tn5 family transposase DNA-binding protein n=1 Tax=Bradyrhizobium cytisi TaxID=515489 RepID=UPI001FEBB331|nr:transposase DNA-binding-containing protein [Bradyrhizobium cytisi]